MNTVYTYTHIQVHKRTNAHTHLYTQAHKFIVRCTWLGVPWGTGQRLGVQPRGNVAKRCTLTRA